METASAPDPIIPTNHQPWGTHGPGRAAAVLGALSFVLLVAAFLWAHHWGLRADLIVGAWAIATIAAIVFSVRAMRARPRALKFAKLGFALASISVFVLLAAGVASAAGADPGAMCGGG